MKKNELLIFLLFILAITLSVNVNAGTGAWPKGPDIFLNKPNFIMKNSDVRFMTGDPDNPSAVAKDATLGSLYIESDTGVMYQKQDTGASTSWQPMILGPSGSGTDNCVVRWDGSGVPLLQDSIFCITDAGVGSGLTQFNLENLRLDGNTISSTSGNVIVSPTGSFELPFVTASLPLKVDASKYVTSGAIDLTTEITGVLPVANGGTNSSTALNNDRMLVTSGGSVVEAAALLDGYLMIGATGGAPAPASMTGTANQISVTNGVNSITLSTPQDIHTAATPTFASMTIDNLFLDGNTIFSTAGNIIISPTGSINLPTVAISGFLQVDGSGDVFSGPAGGASPTMIRLTNSGTIQYGSTDTNIPLFDKVINSIGTDVTYANAAANGTTFTINTSGTYHLSWTDKFNDFGLLGFSLNSSALTSTVETQATNVKLTFGWSIGAGFDNSITWSGYLESGDIIRPHGGATTRTSAANRALLSISN